MSASLGCPECETPATFTLLHVTGEQDRAAFDRVDGDPVVTDAGAVHVDDYDPGQLCCSNCGAVVGADDLVPIDEEEADR